MLNVIMLNVVAPKLTTKRILKKDKKEFELKLMLAFSL
jgi:hypothetical protein